MNRRFFLASLGAAVLDPERLLWVPGKKLISIPKPMPLSWEEVLGELQVFCEENGDTFTITGVYVINPRARFSVETLPVWPFPAAVRATPRWPAPGLN